jgi:hypothetical protein
MRTLLRLLVVGSLAAVSLATVAPSPVRGDDRQLLRSGSGDPYVMILFDTSGSMNWSPRCTAQQVADGICSYLCPDGDCPTPRNGDDPASKFRQAKEAMYEVLRSVENIHFGFATYNQDDLRVAFKEWLYRVAAVQPDGFFTLAGGTTFPAAGTDEVFGAGFACDQGNGDAEIGCNAAGDDAADTNDLWEMTRVRRFPKLGDDLNSPIAYYIRSGGQVYWVRTTDPPTVTQALGDAVMRLRTELFRCTGSPASNPTNGCNAAGERALVGTKDIVYTLVGDFVKWENAIDRDPEQGGFDGVAMSSAANTCAGWDPNTTAVGDPTGVGLEGTAIDPYNGYSLRFPNGALLYNPPGTNSDWRFRSGDVLPLVWSADNKAAVLNRLAPRLNGGDPTTDPEAFAVATYLNDHPLAGQDYLRLRNEALRPLLPNGSTPLGWALKSIREWFRGCENGSCPSATGWDDIAAATDPDWECRQKYLLVITDGDDTCSGRDPCSLTASMHSLDDITTYVVAFGVENTSGNRLNCMAANGGSGDPIYPQNKQELIDALTAIFGEIQEEAVAFASAAVPSVQANIADKIYLSSFTPLNESSVWPGRLDAFLKPLPVDADGLPDRSDTCQLGVLEAECFAWDAGDSQSAWDGDAGYAPNGLLLQAPLLADITRFDNSTIDVGTDPDERRIYFGVPASTAAGRRQYFRYPTTNAEQAEFEFVWNLPNPGIGDATNRTTIADVVEFTLAEKQGQATDPDTGQVTQIQFVMGDIFHANPTVVNRPSDFDLYTQDFYWNTPLCGDTDVNQTRLRGPQISYAWFANKHLCRRIMLLSGSNDGQLHAFDGGIFRGNECKLDLPPSLEVRDSTIHDQDTTDGRYDFGSGREIFSFIPSAQMPLVKQLSELSSLTTQYGIDNTPRIADVFIDPVLDNAGNSACIDRQWRTVVLGSYREGGPGFFALDVTQPDVIDTGTNIPGPLAGSPAYVPSCADGGANCGPSPFPSLLWEFQDVSDEDGIGGADLGESWSRPVVARIQVCDGACDSDGEPEDRFVAIVGGGLPETPTNSVSDVQGNWLYMIDVETGRIIYKRGGAGVIEGAVPGDVALLDANLNGLAETLYFGTTAGYVYKLDLGEGPFSLGSDGRIQDPTGVAGRFDPFKVFTTADRPIYMEVNLVYLANLRRYALLFGTGNRWDLWDFGGTDGRFYAIVDTGWKDGGADGLTFDGLIDPVGCTSCTQPLTEAVLQPIDPDSAFDIDNPGPSLLFGNPNPALLAGWYFPLGADEKLITEPFTLSGISFFTIFDPISSSSDGVCALGGESKIFIVNTVNAVGYVPAGTSFERYSTAPKFTTQPFAESSATQNQGGSSNNADTWSESLRTINRELKELQPPTCRFANYTIDIKTIRSDTGIVFVAPVPVCIEGHNWKEY